MNDKTVKDIEKRTLKLFKFWSLFYDSKITKLLYFKYIHDKAVDTIKEFKEGPISQTDKFLDIACGTGEIISRLGENNSSVDFVGVDFSEDMLKKASAKTSNLENVKTTQANVRDLPFDDNDFEVILCSDAFHHFAQPHGSLKETYRVLQDEGLFLLIDPAYNSFPQRIMFDVFVKIWDRPVKYYPQRELSHLLEDVGFEVEEVFVYYFTNFFVCRK